MRRHLCVPLCLAVLLVLSLAGSALAAPPLPGAIFTTNVDGTQVNGNIYPAKCDVYLDGGPGNNAPQHAASLPDGDYYFQVTDPSGKTLLSTDPVNRRQIRISAGIITGPSGLGNHNTGVDVDHGAATIQLCPFLDTPNNGGVYKVWVTRIEDFVGDPALVDNGYSAGYFHGFIPAASKVDTFKVRARTQTACLTVRKLDDAHAHGVLEPGQPELNWPISVLDPNGAAIQGILFTPVTLCGLVAGTYTVTEYLLEKPGWDVSFEVTGNFLDGVSLTPPDDTVLVKIGRKDRELIFLNDVTFTQLP